MLPSLKKLCFSLLLCLLITPAGKAQSIDFSTHYDMDKYAIGTVSGHVGSGAVLHASEDYTNWIKLTLTDNAGDVIWSYYHQPFDNDINIVRPVEIRPSFSFGSSATAIVYGTVYKSAPPEENRWTSDLFAMKVELSTGNLLWWKVFGTPKKDVCKGVARGQQEFVNDPNNPYGFISINQDLIYAFQGDPDRPQITLGSEAILTVPMSYDGTIGQCYSYTPDYNTYESRLMPTDHVRLSYWGTNAVVLTGRMETWYLSSTHANRLNQYLFSIQIPLNTPTSPQMYRHDIPYNPNETAQRIQISTAFTGSFFPTQYISYDMEGKIHLFQLDAGLAQWGKKYQVPAEYGYVRAQDNSHGHLALLIDESSNKISNYVAGGLLSLDTDGNFQNYVRYTDHNYYIGRDLMPENGRYLISTLPEENGQYAGFALRGTDSEGRNSGECWETAEVSVEDFEIDSQENTVIAHAAHVDEENIEYATGLGAGYLLDCEEGWRYRFIGEGRFYGYYPTKTAVTPDSETELSLSPNPVADAPLHLRMDCEEAQVLQLSIYDVTGREVLKREIALQAGHNDISIDTQDWTSGLHIARISQGNQVLKSLKVIKN